MLIKVILWLSCVTLFVNSEGDGTPQLRIVGGFKASTRYPFMASYQSFVEEKNTNFHFCGASIVRNNCIVTAAHCVAADYPNQSILVGVNNLDDPLGERYTIRDSIIHPNYVELAGYDIAVLRTNKPIEFSERVGPITQSKNFIGAGIQLRLIGWGLTDPIKLINIPPPRDLQELRTMSISNSLCNANLLYKPTETDICTSRTGNGANNGDSGGPLFQYQDNNAVLVGVVSRGFRISAILPDIFLRASLFVDWINEQCDRP